MSIIYLFTELTVSPDDTFTEELVHRIDAVLIISVNYLCVVKF